MQAIVESRGVDIAVAVDRRVAAPATAVFVHATGFCKETWGPVVDALEGVTTVTMDQRGHGRSGTTPPPFDWWHLGADVLAVVDHITPDGPLVGVGHSSGGAAVAMAEVTRPGTFAGMVLVEPIVPPGPYERTDHHPLTEGALRRRRDFGSLDDVLDTFRGRGPFALWTDEALSQYARFGTVARADATRALACEPETEAEFYRGATAHGTWERLGEIACPVTVVVGEASQSHPPDFAASLTTRFPDGRLVTVPGATHFVPMEQPEAVAQEVSRLAAGI